MTQTASAWDLADLSWTLSRLIAPARGARAARPMDAIFLELRTNAINPPTVDQARADVLAAWRHAMGDAPLPAYAAARLER